MNCRDQELGTYARSSPARRSTRGGQLSQRERIRLRPRLTCRHGSPMQRSSRILKA